MNLIPIDSAAAVPAVAEPSATTGTDFGALMAGLMAGDAQIAPVIDIPLPPAQPAAGQAEALSTDNDSMLELIGAPPAGMTLTTDTEPPETTTETDIEAAVGSGTSKVVVTDVDVDPVGGSQADVASVAHAVPPTPPSSVPPVATPDGEANGVSGTRDRLASVHPITSKPAPVSAEQQAPDPPDNVVRSAAPLPTAASFTAAPPLTSTAVGPAATTEGHDGRLGTVSPIHPPPAQQTAPPAVDMTTLDRPLEPATDSPDIPIPDGDSDLDVSSWFRSAEPSGRPTSTPGGPAMVGLARRVEEAIAALATKPDPKIVTLQLDELDGVRLTVALRPDGIHLSSTGDAALTADIERALASRGFDLASDSGRQDREAAPEAGDDGWTPRAQDRRRRSDKPGITL
jgi:hypothetical protein